MRTEPEDEDVLKEAENVRSSGEGLAVKADSL